MINKKLWVGLVLAAVALVAACGQSEEWCKEEYGLDKRPDPAKSASPGPVDPFPTPIVDLDPNPGSGTFDWSVRPGAEMDKIDLVPGNSIFDPADKEHYCRLRADFFGFSGFAMVDPENVHVVGVEKVQLLSPDKKVAVVVMKDPGTGKMTWAAMRIDGTDVTLCPLIPTTYPPSENNLIPKEFAELSNTSLRAVILRRDGKKLTLTN